MWQTLETISFTLTIIMLMLTLIEYISIMFKKSGSIVTFIILAILFILCLTFNHVITHYII